jgi:nicotinate phosphoribosyltransferase
MCNRALFTDLYELTMTQAYHVERMDQFAVFELAFRQLPQNRNFIVAAGFGDILDFLGTLRFSDGDLDYLRGHGQFTEELLGMFMQCLRELSFSPTSRCCK